MRHHRLRPRIWLVGLLGPIWLLAATLPAQEASAHPIDEYVQNTYIDLAPDRTTLQIDLTAGVLVAPEVVALIDTDGDGEISEAEGASYANDAVLRDVSLAVDGEPQPLTLVDSSFPTPLDMKAGMGTIRLQVAAGAPSGGPGDHTLSYRNDHQPVNSRYLVNAFETAGGVEISHQDRDELQNGIRVDYTTASDAPATSGGAANASADAAGTSIPERQQRLVGYLYETTLSPWLLVVGLGLSALLGGLHARTPGHGKTLVAAYLIGSRGTVRHAAALGGIVTFTHTASVIAVGLLALLAGQYILPDVLVPALEVCAGLLVVALGARLVRARWRTRGGHRHHDHGHHHHDHGHHHHVPPNNVRPGDLLAMGVSGGLVPCPEALGVMLIAVGLGRIGLGLALIVAFSFGLAAVLIAIGVLLVRSKSRLDRLGKPGSSWRRLLPLVSAVIVTLLGAAIVLKGLTAYIA
ncbi:MAG: sulfite exporter TauE/SafE family protein [Actinomycetota bacterium]|nr:sulfite exporter TauE/SafE family protein [Actinomycetota bacterium]